MPTRLATVLHRAPGEDPITLLMKAPDTSAGDAQFFVNDPNRPVQIRPVLASEVLPGREGKREWVLVALNVRPELRALVKLPAHLRKNDARGVEAAIRKLGRFHPGYAEIFRRASRLTSPGKELFQIQADGSVKHTCAT